MVGILLTLLAALVVIILAFCYSDEDSRSRERVTDLLVRAPSRSPRKKD